MKTSKKIAVVITTDKDKRGAYSKAHKLVSKTLKGLGYRTTQPKSENANGTDLFAISKDCVLAVEIKRATKIKNTLRVRKVEKNRMKDDLIAIVFPTGYVLIEPMKDHLRSCNSIGDRYINFGFK